MDVKKIVKLVVLLIGFESLSIAQSTSFAVIGDCGVTTEAAHQLKEAILESNVTPLILPGDNNYSGTAYENIWNHWLESGLTFDIVAIGNHNKGYDREINYFKMPGEFYTKTYGKFTRFIVLNSDNEKNVDEQMKFLDGQLENSNEKNIFLVYHHPTYTLSRHHSWTEKKEFQTQIRNRLKKYKDKITAVLVGHDHSSGFYNIDGIPMILSGAGTKVRSGKPFQYTDEKDGTFVSTKWFFKGDPTWISLDIDDASGTASVQAHSVRNGKSRCTMNLNTQVLSDNCIESGYQGSTDHPVVCRWIRIGGRRHRRCHNIR